MKACLRSKNRDRGRPERTQAQKYIAQARTLYWCQAVCNASTLQYPNDLEREFSSDKAPKKKNKRKGSRHPNLVAGKWRKYIRGEICPVHDNSGNSLIDQVERKYPGTKNYYEHSLWDALDPDFVLTSSELRNLYKKIEIKYRPFLLGGASATFWKRASSNNLFEKLINAPSIETLTITILEMRFSENAQDRATHFKAWLGALVICEKLWTSRFDRIGMHMFGAIANALLLQATTIKYGVASLDKALQAALSAYGWLFELRKKSILLTIHKRASVWWSRSSSSYSETMEEVENHLEDIGEIYDYQKLLNMAGRDK